MTRRTMYENAARVFAAAVLSAIVSAPAAAQTIAVGSKVGEPMPSAGGYESQGRRDPFVSLIATRKNTPNATPRTGTGLGSFSVTDVSVTGIVRVGGGDIRVAILQNVDKQSYVAKVGNRLADGQIKSIDAVSVVFIEFGEPGVTRPREVRKLLHPIDEVKR
jgi:Tfp pilus assembly protein PilP